MKYIGTVIGASVEHKDRTETRIRIDGLDKPQQIVILWSLNRSPDALRDLVDGTRIVFAAREETMNQRTDVDESTGAPTTVLVAMGTFYDVLTDPDLDIEALYSSMPTQDLSFTGTVVDLDSRRRLITLRCLRHGQALCLQVNVPASCAEQVQSVEVGQELVVTAEERSLTWKVHLDAAGRRATVPQVRATGITSVERAHSLN
ncbi:hypothetical protein ACT3SZ_15165 [Corynebacterium sp. AOP40-9SA-29]|uniref:hypothetical protein n=1 Tax=Corynebacterium sp. AOP40-9SA-29 TaxID=3457677 RepID=UPI0040348A39